MSGTIQVAQQDIAVRKRAYGPKFFYQGSDIEYYIDVGEPVGRVQLGGGTVAGGGTQQFTIPLGPALGANDTKGGWIGTVIQAAKASDSSWEAITVTSSVLDASGNCTVTLTNTSGSAITPSLAPFDMWLTWNPDVFGRKYGPAQVGVVDPQGPTI